MKPGQIPLIKSKKEAELFLLFLMKYHKKFQFDGFHTLSFRLSTDFDFEQSVKPFFFRAKSKTTTEDFLVHTFTEAISWIYIHRSQINDIIYVNNNSGWTYVREGRNQFFIPIIEVN